MIVSASVIVLWFCLGEEKKSHVKSKFEPSLTCRSLFKFSGACTEILERNNITGDDVDWLVPHQANLRIIDAASSRMNLPEEKVLKNIQRYGNTTSATLPLLLFDFEKKLKKGDNLIFAAFGGGFTWGSIYLKWAYNSN